MSDVDPESCTSLVSEATEHEDYVLARVSDTRAINLPRLRKASFYYSGNLRTRTILSLLAFPALERVELGPVDEPLPADPAAGEPALTQVTADLLRRAIEQARCLVDTDVRFLAHGSSRSAAKQGRNELQRPL